MNNLIQGFTQNKNEEALNEVIKSFIDIDVHECCECKEKTIDSEICIICEFHNREDIYNFACTRCDNTCKNRACKKCLQSGESTYYPKQYIPISFLHIHPIELAKKGKKVFICNEHSQPWARNCNNRHCWNKDKKFTKIPDICFTMHCGNYFCDNCMVRCGGCGNKVCNECYLQCSECASESCHSCYNIQNDVCNKCNDNIYENDQNNRDIFEEAGDYYAGQYPDVY